ncbi:hypothetical protein F1331_25460 [Salmonella enterica subsp. enterica serovar Dessau]|uniref:Biotin synthase n=1 Tax=Salmonella enterica subsp. enterica serovar Dessau TaxID=2564349 RepID=A0A8E5IND0_SALET|nr:hypothetical protein F1331_25460 [Salmonella enterica subsp. enterica serovar Dessau]
MRCLDTLDHVREAGINVCCGGIVGMGETRGDRVGFIHALATLPRHPESVPVNALVPVKGTVLGNMLADTPLAKIDDIEFVRTVAVARITMLLTLIEPQPEATETSHEAVSELEKKIVHMLIGYVHALRHHRRDSDPWSTLERTLPEGEVERVRGEPNVPIAILQRMGELVAEARRKHWINAFHVPVFEGSLTALTDIQGACERIKNTPMQCIHNVFIRIGSETVTKPFPMNAWYAAAWDAEVKPALLPRTICGKHVVMYRKADGSVAALEDACWHRLVSQHFAFGLQLPPPAAHDSGDGCRRARPCQGLAHLAPRPWQGKGHRVVGVFRRGLMESSSSRFGDISPAADVGRASWHSLADARASTSVLSAIVPSGCRRSWATIDVHSACARSWRSICSSALASASRGVPGLDVGSRRTTAVPHRCSASRLSSTARRVASAFSLSMECSEYPAEANVGGLSLNLFR